MLQLNHSASFNTIAVLPAFSASLSSSVVLRFSQDYDNSTKIVSGSVISNNNYLIIDVEGSQLPTASGLYTVDIYNGAITNTLVWSNWTPVWTTLTETWPTYSGSLILTTGSLLDIERAWVSGTNDVSVSQYQTNNIVFYTYNG